MAAITPYKGRDAESIVAQALKMYEEDGIEINEAAKAIGVPARSIYRWLATNAGDRWKEIQQARALSDYERVRKERDSAAKALIELQQTLEAEEIKEPQERNWRLAHARECLKAADVQLDHQKWLLERLLAKLYGQRQVDVNIHVDSDWGERLRRAKQRTSNTDTEIIDVTPLNSQE